ncbi:MAG: DUF481 domain-containing protein [Mariprofundus sp.]|nr:DUF481 domain-containing protein [Mariprofundus sp.]
MKYIVTLFITLVLAVPAIAADILPVNGWKNSAELGAVQTSGNTQTLAVDAKATLVHESDTLRHTFEAGAHNNKDRQKTTGEKYNVSLQMDWKFSELDYMFGRFGYESDRFAGFRRRMSETIGYGRELIKTDELYAKFEVGAGFRQSKIINGPDKNDAIFRAASHTTWKISEAAKLSEALSTEGGKNGWTSQSVTALKQKLNGNMATQISLTLDHNSKVPTNTKHLDTTTAVALVFDF